MKQIKKLNIETTLTKKNSLWTPKKKHMALIKINCLSADLFSLTISNFYGLAFLIAWLFQAIIIFCFVLYRIWNKWQSDIRNGNAQFPIIWMEEQFTFSFSLVFDEFLFRLLAQVTLKYDIVIFGIKLKNKTIIGTDLIKQALISSYILISIV